MSGTPAVVSAQWLKQQLDSNPDSIRVLDVSWSSAKDCQEDYKQNHIPGAGYFNIMNEVENKPEFPRNLPPVEAFEKYVQSLGINNDTHVVVYDNTGKCGFFIGGRAWWMFRLHGHVKVSVLNGGLDSWTKEGYPTVSDLPQFQKGNFRANYNSALRREFDTMVANLDKKELQVVDSRAPALYQGSPDKPGGHIPDAKNMPFDQALLDMDNNSIKDVQQLKKVFEDSGIDLDKPVVGYCNGGMSSSTIALAAYTCGARDFSIYHGGWSEWSRRADASQIDTSGTGNTS